MEKIIKKSILFLILMLVILIMCETKVNATNNIISIDDLKSVFDENKIVVEQNKITITEDLNINLALNINHGDYILEIPNEKKLELSGSIKETEGTLVIKNYGTLNLSNADISQIMNYGEVRAQRTRMDSFIRESELSDDERNIRIIVPDGLKICYGWCEKTSAGINVYSYKYSNVGIFEEEDFTPLFNKISKTDTWTIESFIPTNNNEVMFLLTAAARALIDDEENYEVDAIGDEDKLDVNHVEVYIHDRKTEQRAKRSYNVTYKTPSNYVTNKVKQTLKKMKQFEYGNIDANEWEYKCVRDAYRLEDLYLINFYYSSPIGIYDSSTALNYCKDLIKETKGGNISFKFDGRMGTGDDLMNYAGGAAIVFYEGIPYTTTESHVTRNHIIYIPDTTAKNTKAYEEAVFKRITDYLGTTKGITVKYGGKLDALETGECDYFNLIDKTKTDGNYYDITMKGYTHHFVVLTEKENKLETPKYLKSDIVSDISVSSDVTTIPLDTSITVKNVENKQFENVIGTNNYIAYNISLFSKIKNESINKLDKGTFKVSIPIPDFLRDKEIIVYYINGDKKEEYIVEIKDGIATFETTHFSTYILSEQTNSNADEEEEIILKSSQEIKEVVIKDLPENQRIKQDPIEIVKSNLIIEEILKKANEIKNTNSTGNTVKIEKIIGAIEIKLVNTLTDEELQLLKPTLLTFNIGEEYNGKFVYIIHQKKDGKFDYYKNVKVANGGAKIEVTELSPFVIALQSGEIIEKIPEDLDKDDSPKTGVIDIINYVVIIAVISATGIVVLNKKSK